MSISENVGAMSQYLARVLSGPLYASLRKAASKVLRRMPAHRASSRAAPRNTCEGHVAARHASSRNGFNYIGPIDGHDVALVRTLRNQRQRKARSFCTSSRARAKATRRPRPIRSNGTDPVRSMPRAARSTKKKHPGLRSRKFSASGCAMRPPPTSVSGRHHAGDARRVGLGRVS
jgi:hypothetical protein